MDVCAPTKTTNVAARLCCCVVDIVVSNREIFTIGADKGVKGKLVHLRGFSSTYCRYNVWVLVESRMLHKIQNGGGEEMMSLFATFFQWKKSQGLFCFHIFTWALSFVCLNASIDMGTSWPLSEIFLRIIFKQKCFESSSCSSTWNSKTSYQLTFKTWTIMCSKFIHFLEILKIKANKQIIENSTFHDFFPIYKFAKSCWERLNNKRPQTIGENYEWVRFFEFRKLFP